MKYIAILDDYPQMQEIVYKDVLEYCKILQGREWPWSELYNDAYRSDNHKRIAEHCDCDPNLVTTAIDDVFYPDSYGVSKGVELSRLAFSEDNFLKNVDKVMDSLKEIARLPERDRWPSAMTEDEVEKTAEGLTDNLKPMPDLSGATKENEDEQEES